jgi:hypothetical protein
MNTKPTKPIVFNPLDILMLTEIEDIDLTQPITNKTTMTKPHALSDAQLDALIYHYKRIRKRIADNVTAMTRLEALVAEKTDRITAILNDEVTTK